MELIIIDRNEKAKWYLGKISLWDYLESLNLNSFEYDIQRGIVHNKDSELHFTFNNVDEYVD